MDPDLLKKLKLCFNKSPKEAVDYLKSQKVTVSWDWKTRLEAIANHCFTVANVTSADMLQLVFDEVVKAIEEGTPLKEFKDNLSTRFAENGFSNAIGSASRLSTIYRTNLQASYMAGRYYQMKAVEEDFPYWEYLAILDIRTRPNHASLHGKVVKSSDAFWDTHTPVNGFNCRCRVRALDEQDVERKGLRVVSGDSLTKFEPDEGFASNPASEYKPDLRRYAPAIRTALKEALA